jgi:serine/threonine protein kinase
MTADPPPAGDGAPEQVSYYRLERVLGRGGFGVVYAATDVRFDTRVAVKVLHPHLTDDEAYRERFLREIHVVSLLRSPYTVQVHQSGIANGRYFLVMDLIDGGTVADQLRSGPLEPKRALRIAGQVARSLEEAELRGITHRDIKSGNVVFESAVDPTKILSGIEQAISEQFGFDVPVVVLSHGELAAAGARHPLAGDQPDEAKLHVFFLADVPASAAAPASTRHGMRQTSLCSTGASCTSTTRTARGDRS